MNRVYISWYMLYMLIVWCKRDFTNCPTDTITLPETIIAQFADAGPKFSMVVMELHRICITSFEASWCHVTSLNLVATGTSNSLSPAFFQVITYIMAAVWSQYTILWNLNQDNKFRPK